jgi:prepilin-type N-terminal cleavage/methylation domain-containing protein
VKVTPILPSRRNYDPSGLVPLAGDGFSMVELLIVTAIVAVLAAIAVPGLLNARRQAQQTSAIASMHAIASAEHVFAETCGQGFYASRLTQLAAAPEEGGEPFLAPDLTAADAVEKSGYRISLAGGSDGAPAPGQACSGLEGGALSSSFYATASPLDPGLPHYWVGVNGAVFASADVIRATDGRSPPPGTWPISEGTGEPPGVRRRNPAGKIEQP